MQVEVLCTAQGSAWTADDVLTLNGVCVELARCLSTGELFLQSDDMCTVKTRFINLLEERLSKNVDASSELPLLLKNDQFTRWHGMWKGPGAAHPLIPLDCSSKAAGIKAQLPPIGSSTQQLTLHLVVAVFAKEMFDTMSAAGGGLRSGLQVLLSSPFGTAVRSMTITETDTLDSIQKRYCATTGAVHVYLSNSDTGESIVCSNSQSIASLPKAGNLTLCIVRCCPAGHKSKVLFSRPPTYGGNAACDVCRSTVDYASGFLHCSTCKWDLCPKCAKPEV